MAVAVRSCAVRGLVGSLADRHRVPGPALGPGRRYGPAACPAGRAADRHGATVGARTAPGEEATEHPQTAAEFHTGHRHLDPTDKTRDGALISWLDRQRYLGGAGLLAPVRIHELDQLGMIWDKHARSWDRGYAHARAWAETHGHLAIPAAEKLDGHAVGAWAGRQRKNTKLTAAQDAKLTALDAMWRLDPDWNRSYRRMLAYLAAAAPSPARPTAPAARPTPRSGRARGCANRTRPAPTRS
ncbi:helicase associated domain-containing protein [Kitasatospora gansuensis]